VSPPPTRLLPEAKLRKWTAMVLPLKMVPARKAAKPPTLPEVM
jgi:hypothetical protein